jgi:hypothetical protein
MSDRRRIHAGELGAALEANLSLYCDELDAAICDITEDSMKKLVQKTRATAPRGKRNGQFKKNITADFKELTRRRSRSSGARFRGRTLRATWYVKAPDYRLTHLIVKGHETKDGGRTRANPFLQNALDEVLPEYERNIEEAIKNGK